MKRRRVVAFLEDPGAVNCFAPVLQALVRRGDAPVQLAAGHAVDMLRDRGLEPIPIASTAFACDRLAAEDRACLVVGTSENLDSPAFAMVDAARRVGAPSVAIVDAGVNAAHRFRGRSASALTHAPDWLLVPDEWTAREFSALGYAPSRTVVVGHPHDDHILRERKRLAAIGRDAILARLLPEKRPDCLVIVFVSEISTGLDAAQYRLSPEYTLRGRGSADGRTEIVIEEVIDALRTVQGGATRKPYLVLRKHPKESTAELARYVREFDTVSAGGAALELLFAADLVIGMTSMALYESYLLGTPTLAVVPRPAEREWLAISRTGAIDCVFDRAVLHAVLRRHLEAPQQQDAVPTEAANVSSIERILDFLEHTLER